MNANSLFLRGPQETLLSQWRSENEKGRKPIQSAVMRKMLSWALGAQLSWGLPGDSVKYISELSHLGKLGDLSPVFFHGLMALGQNHRLGSRKWLSAGMVGATGGLPATSAITSEHGAFS